MDRNRQLTNLLLLALVSLIAFSGCSRTRRDFSRETPEANQEALIARNLNALENGSKQEMKIAVARLGALKAREAVEPVINIAGNENPSDLVRIALGALGEIADPDSRKGGQEPER